ncbi:hypothetical protein [Erythrobacter sp. MTPC3]|uniref:hypothetical protein n=1 Tax=Erythrobacter sp. MTPC3 TaxID=3056564 RepID=UPI0036F3E12E
MRKDSLRGRFFAKVAALAICCGAPAAASTNDAYDEVNLAKERAAIAQFQTMDQKLQDAGWRLATGNAAFCENAIPATGLQLQDLASYAKPDIARAALGMTGSFAVQTAASGSPAAASGAFPVNREITQISGVDLNLWEARDRRDWRRLKRAHDWMDSELARTRKLSVTFANGEMVTLDPDMACATRFELAARNSRAVADGQRVVIGAGFDGFDYSLDAFAAGVAHELAHNLLRHREWLDRNGRKRRNVRATEREADRLMPWLLANAGYDPEAAATFMEQYRPVSGAVLFFGGSHDKWQDRADSVRAQLPLIRQLMERENAADWSVHFQRQIDPSEGL